MSLSITEFTDSLATNYGALETRGVAGNVAAEAEFLRENLETLQASGITLPPLDGARGDVFNRISTTAGLAFDDAPSFVRHTIQRIHANLRRIRAAIEAWEAQEGLPMQALDFVEALKVNYPSFEANLLRINVHSLTRLGFEFPVCPRPSNDQAVIEALYLIRHAVTLGPAFYDQTPDVQNLIKKVHSLVSKIATRFQIAA